MGSQQIQSQRDRSNSQGLRKLKLKTRQLLPMPQQQVREFQGNKKKDETPPVGYHLKIFKGSA